MTTLSFIIWFFVFASATLFIYGFLEYRDSRRTIRTRVIQSDESISTSAQCEKKDKLISSWLIQFLQRFGNLVVKDQERLSDLRQQLIYGGFRQSSAPIIYSGLRVMSAMLLPLPYLLSKIIQGLINTDTLLYACLFAGVGYMLPQYFLKIRVRKRQSNIERALPDVLDLFIICAEAGLALPATINKVAAEIKDVSIDFYQELQLTALELRTGLPWDVALHHLGERTGVLSVKSFVSLLVQTDKMGINIAQALRTQADFSRTQRALKAEEMANKLPVKMVFPLAACIFPGILIVVAGPGVIRIIRIVLPILQGRGH
jgi:tight adherence protein C